MDNNPDRVPLVDLLEDPEALQQQLYRDALLALEAIRTEIAEKGFVNTQKAQAFVSLTKLVTKMLEEQREIQRPDPLNALLGRLPFQEDGVDNVIQLPE